MHAATLPVPATAVASPMRAIVHPRYGTPEVLSLAEVARPEPGADEVLVAVHAASASIGDHHVVTGKPYLIRLSPFGGLPRPRHRVPGTALAGKVVALGANVTGFAIGDEVFGDARHGAFAEYAVVAAARLAPRPATLTFEEAAAAAWAVTALQGLRDAGRLRAGQRVLINGASGGVGTWAVQIAKALGAHVTAVCSTRNVEMVRGLGANEVIDYTTADFAAGAARFDLMFDLIGNRPLSACARVLTPRGTYVACAGGGGDWVGPMFRLGAVLLRSLVSGRRFTTFVVKNTSSDLRALAALIEAGKARPIIERTYPLGEVAQALAHVGSGRTRGQVVIRVA